MSSQGLKPNPEKVRLDPPTTVKGVRSILALSGYYRNFIPKYSSVAKSL